MSNLAHYVNLAESEGYEMGRDVHVSRNGNLIQLVE
jgi:ribonuclease J